MTGYLQNNIPYYSAKSDPLQTRKRLLMDHRLKKCADSRFYALSGASALWWLPHLHPIVRRRRSASTAWSREVDACLPIRSAPPFFLVFCH